MVLVLAVGALTLRLSPAFRELVIYRKVPVMVDVFALVCRARDLADWWELVTIKSVCRRGGGLSAREVLMVLDDQGFLHRERLRWREIRRIQNAISAPVPGVELTVSEAFRNAMDADGIAWREPVLDAIEWNNERSSMVDLSAFCGLVTEEERLMSLENLRGLIDDMEHSPELLIVRDTQVAERARLRALKALEKAHETLRELGA
ncbi:hypothetical protein [Gordonia sihwensis]|nr:hypothetical protein [Gordonia sihwensis]WFN95184.1 hypothetical protein P5P27_20680 [Gordonia sihwensis]